MKILKTILHYDYIFYSLFFIALIYSVVIINLNISFTKYSGKETAIDGYVTSIKKYETYTNLIIKAKEKVVVIVDKMVDYQLGDYISLTGQFEAPSANRNTNLFNYKNYLLSKKIYWSFEVKTILLIRSNTNLFYKIKNNIYNNVNMKQNDYLNAYILGDSSNIDESYSLNGIMHLFALSGMHISIISYGLLNIISKYIKRTIISYSIILVLLYFYLFISSFSISIVRSFILFLLIFLNRTFNLLVKKENIIMLIASLFIFYNPYIIFSMGFQLSFSITYTLAIMRKYLYRYTNYYSKSLYISYISFLISMPIIIDNFYGINLLAVFSTIIFSLIVIIVYPLSLITLFLPNSNALNLLTGIMDQISANISLYRLEIPLSSLSMGGYFIYYATIILIIYKLCFKKYYYGLLIIIVLFIHTNINQFNQYNSLNMIDVGQGDSILLNLKHNQGNILFDTGALNSNYTVIPYLKSIGVRELDYLVITHGDLDHAKEAINIINNLKVNYVLFNSEATSDLENLIINVLKVKKIKYMTANLFDIKIGDANIKFINDREGNENNNSLVALININNYNLLLAGDAPCESEHTFVSQLPLIDVLKVGHHGSVTSSCDELINKIKPVVSLISVGKNNIYKHPNSQVLAKLSNYYLTSEVGMINIIFKDSLTIYTRFNK